MVSEGVEGVVNFANLCRVVAVEVVGHAGEQRNGGGDDFVLWLFEEVFR